MEGTSGFCGTRVENHCNGVKREKKDIQKTKEKKKLRKKCNSS